MTAVVIHGAPGGLDAAARALIDAGIDVTHAAEGTTNGIHLLHLPVADATVLAPRLQGHRIYCPVSAPDRDAAVEALGDAFDDVVAHPVHGPNLAARVRSALAAAQTTSLRSRSLRMVAHDVNNPLTAIRLLAEMLGSEMQSQEARQDMQDILEASDLAAAYVESMSALAKLELTSTDSLHGSADAKALLQNILKRPCMRTHIESTLAEGPAVVQVDRGGLQQAILDVLLTGRRLTDGRATCRVGLVHHAGSVLIRVDAEGASIPEHMVDDLFTAYGAPVLREARIQVAPAGLAHARSVARRAGGALWLVQGASGVSFHLELPLATPG